MLQTKLYKKYFPLDVEKIKKLESNDREEIIKIFRKTTSEIRGAFL